MFEESIVRTDAREKVTGEARYSGDLDLPGVLHLKLVRSDQAHGLITGIEFPDISDLSDHYFFTAADLKENSFGSLVKDQPVFADKKVRFYGEPVAMVAAPDEDEAAELSGQVRVFYEPLPVITDPEPALRPGAVPVQEEGNLANELHIARGDIEVGFSEADLIVSGTFDLPMQEHLYLETESGVAWVDERGVLTVSAATQNPFLDREEICRTLGIPREQVRIKTPWVGGAFGGKDGNTVQIYLALAAWKTGRPVRLIFSRRESLIATYKRHPARVKARIGFKKDGSILAFQGEVYFDTGAYRGLGPAVLGLGIEHFAGPYRVGNLKLDGYLVFTNKPPASAFRGFGAFQTQLSVETLINRGASRLGIDPIELRRKNALRKGDNWPLGNQLVSSVGLLEALETLRETRLWRERADNRDPELAWGMAAGSMCCGIGVGIPDTAEVTIEKQGEGYLVRAGTVEIGQGMLTALSQLAAGELEVPIDRIEIISADTEETHDCGTTAASRVTFIVGNALIAAARKLREDGGDSATGSAVFPGSLEEGIEPGLPHRIYSFIAAAVKLRVDPLTGEIALL
ncbi:MAG TPA: xanthine dehydrogenase family protein molybdopterin-binding subunit, partial [Proteobacteria bacterium]|nr:xanthine dehydrogenase family protein molybdopterin-binding subunit [Pseudomonadota bacterium]